jgi:hypothetical protein
MTIDMTNNRVPYGLLTDEEKTALHEHEKAGGGFCVTRPLPVSEAAGTSWVPDAVYRTVPLPKTQDVIAWERLPDWVEWVAREQGNRVYAADIEMQLYSGLWMCHSKRIRIDDFPGIVQIGTCDWKDSKQRRPR